MLRLCRFAELAAGSARGFDPGQTGGDTLFVLRTGDRVLGYLNRCPHQGARLEYRKDKFLSADGRHIVCYAHGAYFDPASGVCTQGACLGQSLQSLPCTVQDGWVWARVGEGATA